MLTMIGRGLCDWHAEGVDGRNKFSSSGGTLEHYLGKAPDGCAVYDAHETSDQAAFARLVVSGPMYSPTLGEQEIQRFSDLKPTLARMAPYLEGEYRTVAVLALAEDEARLGALDYVGRDVFLALMRERVPGVKIGHVERGAIVWDAP